MRLTAYTDYSLRVLIYLGLRDDRLVTIGELSETYGLSANHVMKIAHNLGKLGFIETVRGRGGGMRLAGDAARINLGRVVRQMEPGFAVVECFDSGRRHQCAIAPACRLQPVLEKAVEAFLGVLDGHTLADLLQKRARLGSLLGIAPAARRPG